MEKRRLGSTDMEVTRLGFGGARIGFEKSTDEEAARLLNGLLDAGVNFIDTAACYEGSEEQIGRLIAARRSEYYLATKAGHVVDGATGEPYSEPVITESIERSLKRLNTEAVDLVQIHSCSAKVLRRGEAANALVKAQEAGKTRYIGFSGDGDAAAEAIGMGVFDTSANVVQPGRPKRRRRDLPHGDRARSGHHREAAHRERGVRAGGVAVFLRGRILAAITKHVGPGGRARRSHRVCLAVHAEPG